MLSIPFWRVLDNLKENLDKQSVNTKNSFQEKLLTLEGSLHHHGFNAKPYYEVTDFTKELALVPCSAKSGEGIQELILTLAGISEKFLKANLELGKDPKGVILEIKKEKDRASVIQQIKKEMLFGYESNENFVHITDLEIYKRLTKNN